MFFVFIFSVFKMAGLHAGYNNPTLRLWQVIKKIPTFSRSPETYFKQFVDSTFERKKVSGFGPGEKCIPVSDPRSLEMSFWSLYKASLHEVSPPQSVPPQSVPEQSVPSTNRPHLKKMLAGFVEAPTI